MLAEDFNNSIQYREIAVIQGKKKRLYVISYLFNIFLAYESLHRGHREINHTAVDCACATTTRA